MYNTNIPGWFSIDNFKVLENLAKEIPQYGIMVELGAFMGRSAWAWAKSVDPSVTVYCVDEWDSDDESWYDDIAKEGWDIEDIFPLKEKFMHYTKDCHNIKPIQKHSPFSDGWNKRLIDLCFIDGSKTSMKKFTSSFEFWFENININGIICGHDYDSSIVEEGVNLMSQKFNKDFTIDGNIWIMR